MSITTVTAGETATDHVGRTRPVAECCGNNNGHWCCVLCGKAFARNFDKDTHLGEPGNHHMAWYCVPCDQLEQP